MLGCERPRIFLKVRAPSESRKLPKSNELEGAKRKARAKRKNGSRPTQAREMRRGRRSEGSGRLVIAFEDPTRQAGRACLTRHGKCVEDPAAGPAYSSVAFFRGAEQGSRRLAGRGLPGRGKTVRLRSRLDVGSHDRVPALGDQSLRPSQLVSGGEDGTFDAGQLGEQICRDHTARP